jgi:hypothetical protein
MATQLVSPVSKRATAHVCADGHAPASLHRLSKPHGRIGTQTGTSSAGSFAVGWMSQDWSDPHAPSPKQQ